MAEAETTAASLVPASAPLRFDTAAAGLRCGGGIGGGKPVELDVSGCEAEG